MPECSECPKRMRGQVLPRKGYVLEDGWWVNHETGDRIENVRIDVEHTALTLQRPELWWETMKVIARAVVFEKQVPWRAHTERDPFNRKGKSNGNTEAAADDRGEV